MEVAQVGTDLPQKRPPLAGPYPWIGGAGALLIAVTAPVWRLDRSTWRLTIPGLPHDGTRPFTTLAFVIGVALLTVGWIGLMVRVERSSAPERSRTRTVLLTSALWFGLVLLGPPLLSSDVYSYAAQGEMVTRGLDPTSDGMYRLLSGNFVAQTDPVWRNSPGNPYGPVQMGLAAAVVTVAGHDPSWSIWGLRLLAVAGMALAAWGVHDLARRHRVPPPVALSFAIANPIAVLHLVGGGHNDAIMTGLLCAGCALSLRGRWGWGIALVALATAVKVPAAAALVYLAWCRRGPSAPWRDRVRESAAALGVGVGVIAIAGAVVGIGFGWVGAMRNAGVTMGTLSLPTQAGFAVSGLLDALGAPVSSDVVVGLFRLAGLAVAGIVCLWLLWRADRFGPVRATGLALLAVAALGPALWPWYLAPALALMGAAGMGRWRPSAVVLCAAFALEVMPTGTVASPILEHQHLYSLGLIVLIVALAAAAPLVCERWGLYRARWSPGEVALRG